MAGAPKDEPNGDVTTFDAGVGDWPLPWQMTIDQRVSLQAWDHLVLDAAAGRVMRKASQTVAVWSQNCWAGSGSSHSTS